MSMKYYLSRFWLAISVSFYLFIPYLSRYIDEKNRFVFHWTRWDLTALLFCSVMLGTLFFICFMILYVRGKELTKKAFSLSFIAVCGIALVANILQPLKADLQISFSSPKIHWLIWLYTGYCLWTLLGIILIFSVFKHTNKIKTICITLGFIISPIILIFTFNTLRYPSITSNMGSLPAHSESKNNNTETVRNVYMFIFDEWSYLRSFSKRKLITEFKNLEQFEDTALVFHKAYSPSTNTLLSMPALLFQTNLRFTAKGGRMGFRGKRFHPLNQAENIFHHARELDFYTCIIGSYVPYGGLLGEGVDFAKSIPVHKRFGDNFFCVAKYHLVTASLLLPDPFFVYPRRKVTNYFFNRFQVNRNNTIHEIFKTIVQNQPRPTFAVFHYMIPHFPYVYNRDGHKKFFNIYKWNPCNYHGNLAYLDKMIGEIISVLKKSNKFDNSLIIMTSDHSWRNDPNYFGKKKSILKRSHIPLFIKLPYQDHSIKINSRFTTSKLGTIINNYLDGNFTIARARSILRDKSFFLHPIPASKKKKPPSKILKFLKR